MSFRDATARSCTTAGPRRSWRTWTSCRTSPTSIRATWRSSDYFIGYLKHPYVSLYTGRGCRSRCTFCLWPQTIGGHPYRTRSARAVLDEMARITKLFPRCRKSSSTTTPSPTTRRAPRQIARGIGKLGMTWSCNAKANVPYETLKVLRDNGLRLLLVGYESGNQQILHNIKKGIRIERARKFTKDCHDLGITIHGTFIVGPARRDHGDHPGDHPVRQGHQPTHPPGLDRRALSGHRPLPTRPWRTAGCPGTTPRWSPSTGSRPRPSATPISTGPRSTTRSRVLQEFYFRAGKIAEMSAEMLRSPDMMRRRLREGAEFIRFLRRRDSSAS